MGQIIQLPLRPAGFPDTAAALDPAECTLLTAIRWWVDAYRRDEDPMPRLCQGLETAGASDAAFSVNALMATIARPVQQPITIHCPRCPHLSDDERHLLHAASLAQAGDGRLAENALRAALLSAQGAEFALGPLWGLGGLFAEAGLFFRRRRPPAAGLSTVAAEPSLPSTFRKPSIDRRTFMERHLSTGVATIVALMAAYRSASGRGACDPMEHADSAVKHVAPRDQVGDWLLSLARRRALSGDMAAACARRGEKNQCDS